MTSISPCCMSQPISKLSSMKPSSRAIELTMLVTPGMFLRTRSWPWMICSSISSGAAARQPVKMNMRGGASSGRSWMGRR